MKRLLLALAIAALPAACSGEGLVALTAANTLIRFDSATPNTVVSSATINGLLAGDALEGIDVRPSNGLLYGFAINSGTGRVYTLNPASGLATLAATLAADPADAAPPTPFTTVAGEFFGVDFNPVADRLRVVSDSGQSLRINLASGFTQLDVSVAYAGADANAGTTPAIVASAYTNSVSPTPASTTLYNFDASIGTLVTQAPPNDGTLNTIAILDASPTPDSGFDISGATGIAYAIVNGSNLLTVSLTTGAATDLGAVGTLASINDLAVMAIPEPATGVLGTAALLFVRRRRRRR